MNLSIRLSTECGLQLGTVLPGPALYTLAAVHIWAGRALVANTNLNSFSKVVESNYTLSTYRFLISFCDLIDIYML